MSHCDFTTNLKMGEICLLDYHGIRLNVRCHSVYNRHFQSGRKMSHCEYRTNFKTGEICLPDYHGIQFNVRNASLYL